MRAQHGQDAIVGRAMSEPTAIILLSGGIDSSTCLAIAASQGFACHALTLIYGQRNALEVDAARAVARAVGAAQHRVQSLDLSWIGASALTGAAAVPKSPDGRTVARSEGIPITYVPARNSVFLAVATAWAEAVAADHLFIGANQVDFSGYPDCRPAFIEAMQRALRLGTQRHQLAIHTPLMDLGKAEIIRSGAALGLDYGLTWSCYDPQPGDRACGRCDSCVHRRRGFRDAGIPDPTPYVDGNG